MSCVFEGVLRRGHAGRGSDDSKRRPSSRQTASISATAGQLVRLVLSVTKAYLAPETSIPSPDPPLEPSTRRKPHLSPELARGAWRLQRLWARLRGGGRLVELEVHGRRAADVAVTACCKVGQVFARVQCEERDRRAHGLVCAGHAQHCGAASRLSIIFEEAERYVEQGTHCETCHLV
jgi:hypothetical protein